MTPALGEVRAVVFNYAPVNWHICDGTLLSVSQYQALFSLLGTTYGGDGVNTFGIPDLRGKLVVGQGTGTGRTNRPLGSYGAAETITLLEANLPVHSHTVQVSTQTASVQPPTNNYLAAPVDATVTTNTTMMYLPNTYTGTKTVVPLDPSTVSSEGNNGAHENRMPFIALNYIIALLGEYPQQS